MTRKLISGIYLMAILGTTAYLGIIVYEAVAAMGQVYSNIENFADPEYSFKQK